MSIPEPADLRQIIRTTRILPLFYHPDPETAINVMKAVFEGGIPLMEFTNRGPAAYEVFKQMHEFKSSNYPNNFLGIGSIVDANMAVQYLEAGADFMVSPLLNHEIIKVCGAKNVLYIPGCSTLTEIYQAEIWGAEMVKVFPAEQLGGPAYIKAIKGPCPWLSILVTGGVKATHENLLAWHNAGVEGFGLGSDLISKELVNQGKYEELTNKIKDLVSIVKGLN